MSIQPEGLFVGMTTLMEHRSVDAVLLDMDGTILNSIKAAERVWGEWALRHGLDVDAFLPTVHGVQSVETIRSEEHTSELQSLMRISYAVFCLTKILMGKHTRNYIQHIHSM